MYTLFQLLDPSLAQSKVVFDLGVPRTSLLPKLMVTPGLIIRFACFKITVLSIKYSLSASK